MISPKEFKDYHWYKYVVLENGVILFGEVNHPHSSLTQDPMKPIGAGKIKYFDNTFSFDERGSFTLNLKEAYQDQVIKRLSNIGITEAEGEAFY